MLFIVLAGIFFIAGIGLFVIMLNKVRSLGFIALFFCTFLGFFSLFISATFPPTPTIDNIEFLTERILSPDENGVLISSKGVSTNLNLYEFFEDFEFKRISSEQFRIVESSNYDEITLQLYSYKDNLWYSDIFSSAYLYVLIVPAD